MKFFEKYIFLIIFLSSFCVYIAHTLYTKTSIFADGKFYFAITRSLVKDHDIKFANEFEALGMDKAYTFKDYSWNMYPPGVSYLWIPPFFYAEGLDNIMHFLYPKLETSGFNNIYQSFAALGSIFLGVFGLYLLYTTLRDFFSKKIVLLSIFSLFAATNLLFYIAVEPINSHAASFFISSLFLYYFLRHQDDKHYYLTLGVIGGFAGLIRTQDILLLILPIMQIFLTYIKRFKKLTAYYLLLTAGTLLGFLPQIYFWKKIFNTFWYSPYLKVGLNLFKPQVFYVLFNTQNGLFITTPIVAIAFLGIFLLKSKFPLLYLYSLFYFLIQLYLISSWSNYYQGGSFSIRMIITTYPLLSFGLAQIVSFGLKVLKESYLLYTILGFSLLNCLFILNYLLSY